VTPIVLLDPLEDVADPVPLGESLLEHEPGAESVAVQSLAIHGEAPRRETGARAAIPAPARH